MSRQIDQITLWALALFLFFIAFMTLSGENILVSMLFSAIACIALHHAWKALGDHLRGRTKKERERYARHLVEEWTLLDTQEAQTLVGALFQRRLANYAADTPIALAQLPSSSRALNADYVLSVWREHAKRDKVIIAALCPADSSARQFAARLHEPSIEIVDSKRLTGLLVKDTPVVPSTFTPPRKRREVLRTCTELVRRINGVRSGFYAVVMIALYFASGRILYLIAFMLLTAMLAFKLLLKGAQSA